MIEQRYRVSYEFTLLLKTNATGYELKRLVMKHIKVIYPNLINICTGKAITDTEYHAYCIPELTTDVDRYEFAFNLDNVSQYLPYFYNRAVDCTITLDIKRWDNTVYRQLPRLIGSEQIIIFKKVFSPYFDKLPEDHFKIDILQNRYL